MYNMSLTLFCIDFLYCSMHNTHTTVLLLVWNMSGSTPGSAGTRKVKPRRLKPIWIYGSKR